MLLNQLWGLNTYESKPVLGFESSLLSQKNGQSYLQTKEFQ